MWLYSGGFRGCALMGFCGYAPVSFMVVRSDLWAGGATAVVDSWWSWRGFMEVGLGLWRCGCGFGIVEVGCAMGLLQRKEKKSLERKRRTNREMNNKKI